MRGVAAAIVINCVLSIAPARADGPRVKAVHGPLRLGQSVFVEIEGLPAWKADPSHQARKLVPYINGRALPGIYPDECHDTGVFFHLVITPESWDMWEDLLRRPKASRPVTFSVGLAEQSAFATVHDENNRIPLVIIPRVGGVLALVIVAFTALGLVILAVRTNLLRDAGQGEGLRPYNLGRVQMAFWFFLVVASYLCLWLITGNLDTLTDSILVLIGISTGTALGDAAIDAKRASEAGAAAAATPAASAEAPPATEERRSKGFFHDVLSDGGGYSFHRFQIFVWTLVLGLIFVVSVYGSLAMPKFSPTLLGLMGISAGTYIGFKFPDPQKAAR